MQKEGTENLNKLLPALSGSCALLAFLDVGRNQCVLEILRNLRSAVCGDADGWMDCLG